MLLQSFNPMLGSLTAGAGGFMFLGIPLLWFFVGREIADRRLVDLGLYCVVGLAVAIGAYGLWQTEVAMPSWDAAWVDLNGYEALSVYGVTRAFGTFSSSAEYGIFLGVAVAISAAMLVHRRAIFALTIPFLVFPLFLASGRGVVVLAVLATLVAVGLRTRNTRLALLIVVAGLAVAVVGLRSYGSGAEASSYSSSSSSNPFVAHQVTGLTNPLDPEHSTLLAHADLVVEGVKQGFLHPFGQGTAVTNIAADRFGIGSTIKGTEVDVSNAFVSLGLDRRPVVPCNRHRHFPQRGHVVPSPSGPGPAGGHRLPDRDGRSVAERRVLRARAADLVLHRVGDIHGRTERV